MGRRERARAAIVSLAQSLGLPENLHILSDRWNLVARLGDSQVIAKAAALADLAKADPVGWSRHEVVASQYLADRGVPIQRPLRGNTAFHVVDGIPVSFWNAVPGEPGTAPEQEFVAALANLHRAGSDLTYDLPWFATLTVHFEDSLTKLRDHGDLSRHAVNRLQYLSDTVIDRIVSLDLPFGFIHGDTQRKNAMWDGTTLRWIDLEECSIGPYAWDLACFTMNPLFDGDRVRDQYATLTGTARVSDEAMATLQHARDLEGLTWMLCIQSERDRDFRDATASLLRKVLAIDG